MERMLAVFLLGDNSASYVYIYNIYNKDNSEILCLLPWWPVIEL